MSRFYILDDQGRPVQVADSRVTLRWLESHNATLAEDELPDRGPIVSTFFTGVDCAEKGDPPAVWMTRVHRGLPGMQTILQTYETPAEALAGHRVVLEFVTKLAAEWKQGELQGELQERKRKA